MAEAPDRNAPGWFVLIALHLFPGILITVFYYSIAWVLTQRSSSAYLALMITIALCLVPVQIGIMWLWGTRSKGRGSLGAAVTYRRRGSFLEYTLLPLLLFFVSGVVLFVLSPLQGYLEPQLAGWVPEWAGTRSLIEGLASSSAQERSVTLFLGVLLSGLAAPIVEESYFRGFLLPRMKSLGVGAPVLNTLLFAVYHFFAPWNAPLIFAAFLPITLVVWWRRDIVIGIITHCMLNLSGVIQVALATG